MAKAADITKIRLKDTVDEPLTITKFIGKGGDGVVYKGHYVKDPELPLAIKFYVPLPGNLFAASIEQAAFVKDFDSRYKNELKRLRDVTHPNLQRYISCGKLKPTANYFAAHEALDTRGMDIPFIVTRFIDGHKFDRVLSSPPPPTRSAIVKNILELALALQYLHEKHLLHGDIKIQNVLIETRWSKAVLIDFGFSKSFLSSDPAETSFFVDPRRLPETVRRLLETQATRNHSWSRSRLEELLFPALDLYHFGLFLQEVLACEPRVLTSFDRKYLGYIAEDLLQWRIEPSGDTHKRYAGYICDAKQLLERIQRLEHGPHYYEHAFAHQELAPPRLIVHPNSKIEVRDSLAALMSHPTLRRLHNLNQLSLVKYIYPRATQTRFDHVLSALGHCQRIWKALSHSAKFLFHMSPADIDRLEALTLLHDINHFPFLHYFQEAGIPEVTQVPVIRTFLEDRPQALPGQTAPSLQSLLEQRQITPDSLKRLISDSVLVGAEPPEAIIKSILNAGIDADKLAYLRDDAETTGVPFGLGIDIQGLLDKIDVDLVSTENGPVWHVVFPYSALPAVESVCFARYWNFRRIYWHHTNRAMEAMIIWTIQELYNRPGQSVGRFLEDTKQQGDTAALHYLSEEYLRAFNAPAPISGLTTNRDRIYKRVFGLPLRGNESLLNAFHDEQYGFARRKAALTKIHKVIEQFASANGYGDEIQRGEVLLDMPLRRMDLGGPIFIRIPEGAVEPATKVSPLLKVLDDNFGELSKVLRVFVSPRVRDAVGKDVWARSYLALRKDTLDALTASQFESEMK
jgi:HD superfamily phosphohydrolase